MRQKKLFLLVCFISIIYYADIYYQYIFHACCFFKDKLKTKIVVWINCQLILITRAKFIRKLIKDKQLQKAKDFNLTGICICLYSVYLVLNTYELFTGRKSLLCSKFTNAICNTQRAWYYLKSLLNMVRTLFVQRCVKYLMWGYAKMTHYLYRNSCYM
jgi:hypothetical protein